MANIDSNMHKLRFGGGDENTWVGLFVDWSEIVVCVRRESIRWFDPEFACGAKSVNTRQLRLVSLEIVGPRQRLTSMINHCIVIWWPRGRLGVMLIISHPAFGHISLD